MQTGDTLITPRNAFPFRFEPIHIQSPVFTVNVETENQSELAKLEKVLGALMQEDPSIEMKNDEESYAKYFFNQFRYIWDDDAKVQDVTQSIVDYISSTYQARLSDQFYHHCHREGKPVQTQIRIQCHFERL